MKKYLSAAMAAMMLAGCTTDNLVEMTTTEPLVEEQDVPILFSSSSRGMTRADFTGKEAAEKLDNKFVVFGYKGSSTGAGADATNTVFDNYLVKYTENTAYTTESNVANWEYVLPNETGVIPIKHATAKGITRQSIKYWDYSQPQYDFIAWSTGTKTAIYEEPTGGIPNGNVFVSAIKATPATSPATGLAMGYTMKGAAADLAACYIADLVTIKKANYAKATASYESRVPITFRSLGTKVRIGIYETVPGYSVKNVQFYSAAASDDAAPTPRLFSTTENGIYTYGTYTISFPTVDAEGNADNNQAHVAFDGGTAEQSTVVQWGTNLNYTIREEGEKSAEAIYLGRSSNTATYAGSATDNYYTYYLPNESGVNLNLRVNFTLESIDGSGEKIEVKGATAQVPSIYTQWQPGYAYTYLFKISDKTNGYTGVYDPTKPDDTTVNSDPAGLYPITFDAVVVNAEDGDKTQETITTISTPSITTYQKGSNVVNNDEYTTGNPIYVTVNDGTKETTPDLANGTLQTLTDKAALYTLEEGHTEAEVVDALSMQDDDADENTIKGRSGLVLTKATSELVNSVEYGVDGNAISVGTNQALRFTPAAGTTYAFVYTKTAPTDEATTKYEALNFGDFETGQTKYRYGFKAAQKAGSTSGADDEHDAQKGVKYYNNNDATAALQTPFIGQGVGNLYLDADGNTIATGYAVTGTTYYYTDNNGLSYKAAHNVAYGSPADLGLYVNNGGTYEPTTDTTPADGTAYYYKDASDNYIYCVFLPQQTNAWYEIDTTTYVEATETTAISGMTYFDKFMQNDGVYYVKIIKVQ